MRLNVICTGILGLILAICMTSGLFVSAITTDTDILITQAAAVHRQDDRQEALRLLEKAQALWTQDRPAVGAFVSQEEIDLVITELARLRSHATTSDPDDFYSTCAALQTQLSHIREKSLPTIWNIL